MKRKAKPSAQEIANIAGVSLTLVNRKLAQGRTPRQIISEAEILAQQKHPVVSVTDITSVNGHAANGALNYSQAQAAKENWLARLRELEYQERTRELMPVSYFRVWASRFLVEGRDILMNGPSELADRLAAESDPRAVQAALQVWVDRIMEHFFRTETLWGGGEPLAEDVLRERFDGARLATVKPRR